MTSTNKVVLTGCGNMGRAMLQGWLAEEITDASPHAFPPRTLERASHKK